jgi:hypothetical protein
MGARFVGCKLITDQVFTNSNDIIQFWVVHHRKKEVMLSCSVIFQVQNKVDLKL